MPFFGFTKIDLMEEKRRVKKEKVVYNSGLPVLNAHAAGIDVGDTKYDVALYDRRGRLVTREYGAFTEDLCALVGWLSQEKITTVAIESTGVYWLCLYVMLEEAGIEPWLVNARHAKNVTGRKKDDTDAIWLQKLHSCGLLNKSFQPDTDTRVLRTYVRQRKQLVTTSSDSVRRMQKSLELMNIKLHTVISDILGKTGLSMVKAILEGERSPDKLIAFKDCRIKASDEQVKKSLKGIWKGEYLFMLRLAYDQYMFSYAQVQQCDEHIAQVLQEAVAKNNGGELLEIKKKAEKE